MNEKLKIIISANISEFKQGMKDAKQALEDLKNKSSKVSKQVDANLKSMGTAAANGMKTLSTALAAGAAALIGLAASTQEVQANQAKLVSAFQSAGASAEQATETYVGLYRVLGDDGQATEAAGHLAKLTTNQEDLAEWTNICQGVYATFGDSLPIESMTEAANETAKTGQLTGALADALNWAGVNEEEFQAKLDACNTEAEREALIRETLSGLYDDAAAKYEENAGALMAQQEAQAKLNTNLANFGKAMAPVLTALMTFASTVLEKITPVIQELTEKYGPALAEAFGAAGEAVGNAFGFFVDHWGIFAAIGGVIATIAAAIGLYNVVAAVKAGLDALQVTTLSGLVAALWAQAAAHAAVLAPYLAVVVAITAVIAIIVLCIKHWDEIKEAVTNFAKQFAADMKATWEKAKQFFGFIKDAIVEKITAAFEAVKTVFTNIKNAISEKVQAAKDAVVNTFENIKSGIQSRIDAAKNAISNTFNSIKSTITNVLNAAKSTVTSIFDGIKTGITNKINAAKTAVQTAINAIKGFFNFSWSLPKLKMPHITISGKFSINPPSVPKFAISWYKMGGVFDSPTLFPYGNGQIGGLGEAGAEAIVPLEKNTKWLDKIAERLGAGQSAKIVLEVDGKVFAQTAISSINDLTRQQGKLSLNVI